MVDTHDLAYTPPEVARFTLDEIRRRRETPHAGVSFGVSTIDAKLNPLRPGELVTIIGRPSHYKSGLAQWWARRLADEIPEDDPGSYVVYGTCEMAIEELGLYDLAVRARLDASQVARGEMSDADWTRLEAASMQRGALPLWLLGHSLARRRKRIKMTIETIEQALYHIEDTWQDDAGNGFRARVVFLDYLNLMETDRRGSGDAQRRLDVTSIVAGAKDLALTLGCPVVMLAQAHRRCDDRAWKLPQMQDCMETAAIEQYSDKVLSVWMPKVTDLGMDLKTPGGDKISKDDVPNLLILGILKQKNGVAGGWLPLRVEPERNIIQAMKLGEVPF